MPMCILFVSNTLGVIFHPGMGAIADHSHSTKYNILLIELTAVIYMHLLLITPLDIFN